MLRRDGLHQAVDAFDVRRAGEQRPRRGRRAAERERGVGVFSNGTRSFSAAPRDMHSLTTQL